MNKSSSLRTGIPTRTSATQRVANLAVSALPWIIIAGLLYAGLFVKPQAVGSSVTPPALERRDRVYGIAHGADGALLAAASNGKILAIGAGGIQRASTPVDLSLQDIASFDASRAVAVGNDNVILVTADGGRHWTRAADVPRSQVANKLNRVRAGAGGVAVAVGEMGALLRTDDYGNTWQRLRDEEDLAWNDVAILDGGTLVVVGEFGKVLRSSDGGKHWDAQQPPVPSSLMAVAFRDAANGVAVGLEGVVLATSDGGRSWTRAALPVREHLLDVAWNGDRMEWLAVGAMGRWASGRQGASGIDWTAGVLGEHALSWHTRVLAAGSRYWLSGADIGAWDGRQWTPLASH